MDTYIKETINMDLPYSHYSFIIVPIDIIAYNFAINSF